MKLVRTYLRDGESGRMYVRKTKTVLEPACLRCSVFSLLLRSADQLSLQSLGFRWGVPTVAWALHGALLFFLLWMRARPLVRASVWPVL